MEQKFDTMTGEPLGQKKEEQKFNVMPETEIKQGKKFPKWLKIGGIAVAGVAVIVFATVNIAPRIILGKNYKIVKAAKNHFERNHLMENLDSSKILTSGNYNLQISGNFEENEIEVCFANNLSANQMSLEGKISSGEIGAEGIIYVDDEQVLISAPDVIDEVIRYGYREKLDGDLEDVMRYAGVDLDEINDMLESIFSDEKGNDFETELKKTSLAVIKNMNFKKADKKEFEINGKDKKCTGYELLVDEDLVTMICDAYEDVWDDYKGQIEILNKFTGAGVDEEIFDYMRERAEYMEGELAVYLYKNKIAAITYEVDGEEMTVEFHGGNTPWENTTVLINDDEVMELTGDVKNQKETATLEMDGSTVMEYEYDYKSGNFEFETPVLEISANLNKSGSDYIYKIEEITSYGYSADVELEITLSEGAKISQIKEKDVFDIGNADYLDIIEFISDIESRQKKQSKFKWGW